MIATNYAGRRVLVTGHTGFKGAWLTAWLLRMGAEILGYALEPHTSPSLFELAHLRQKIVHHAADIRDAEAFASALQTFRPDFVFHLAAQAIVSTAYADPLGTLTTNVIGTAVVLDALRAVDWPCAAVMITSDKVYDNREWPWGYRETDAIGGKDIYSGSKGAAELVFHSYWHSYFGSPESPVRLVTARAGNVIGGGDWAINRIVPDCIRAWQGGGTVRTRSPAATRPWQHVLEPLSGYLTLAAALTRRPELHGESFNFGPHAAQNATVGRLIGDLAGIWGNPAPASCQQGTGQSPYHEADALKLNCDKALLQLGWQAALDYRECVTMTGDWYRQVLREGVDAAAATTQQIDRYEALGSARALAWAA